MTKAISNNNDVFQSLIQNNYSVMLIIDSSNGQIIEANRTACEFYGYTYEQLLSLNINQINVLPQKKLDIEIENAKLGVKNYFVFKHKLSSGEVRDVEVYSSKTVYNNKDVIFSIIHDITEYKALEIENQKARISLLKAESIAEIGHWEFNLTTKKVTASAGARKIYGLGLENEELFITQAQAIPLPEYRKKLDKALEDLINNKKPYDIEFKIKRENDNAIRYIHSTAEYIKEKNTVFGVIKDITKQKKYQELLTKQNEEYAALNEELTASEEELRTSNEELQIAKEQAELNAKYYKQLFNMLPYGGEVIDTNGIIIDCSFSNIKMLGYSKDEIIGKHITNFLDKNTKKIFLENFPKIVNGESFSTTAVFIHKTGRKITVWRTGQPILDKNNNITKILVVNVDITEQKQFEEKLQRQNEEYAALNEELTASEEELRTSNEELQVAKKQAEINELKYRNWFDYFPYKTYIFEKKDIDFVIVEANATAYKESNGKIEKLLNIPIKGLFKNSPEVIENIYKCYESQTTVISEQEYTFISTGKQEYVSATYSFIPPNKVQIITIDITDQKKYEQELENQKILFETMFNSIHDGIIITDAHREIILANNGMKTTFGYLPDELIGKSTKILFPDIDIYSDTNIEIFNNKNENKLYITKYRDKNNNIFPGETFGCKLFDANNNWIGNLGIIRDVTERQSLISELIDEKERAQESDRLKSEFINNMSHEIRTPMNGILGFSQYLSDPEITSDKRDKFVKIIQNCGQQLLRIIDDILEISRLGTKQVKVIEQEISLNNLLLEQFAIFEFKAKERNIPLYLNKTMSDKQSFIITDEAKLKKIIGNLLENAFKYTNKGYIEFGYNIVETGHDLSQLEIYVKDTGIGINPENQEKIFERFSQEEKEISRNIGGLGLGLSIAKENTELLGGEITLESAKGKGSVFTIKIPYKPSKIVTNVKEINTDEKLRKTHTVLIVEDEEINYLYLETLIEYVDIDIVTIHAKNGKEAVEYCKNNPNIEFVLMDIKMPEMNGIEATKLIREFNKTITIVAQTAYSTEDEKTLALNAGCNDFISKPISDTVFNEVIKKYIR